MNNEDDAVKNDFLIIDRNIHSQDTAPLYVDLQEAYVKTSMIHQKQKFINSRKAMTSPNNDLRENQIPQVVEPSLYRIQAIKYRVSQRVPERMAGSFHFPWGRCTGGRHPRPPALASKTLIEGGIIPP